MTRLDEAYDGDDFGAIFEMALQERSWNGHCWICILGIKLLDLRLLKRTRVPVALHYSGFTRLIKGI